MSNNLTEHRCVKLQEMTFVPLVFLSVCGVACACILVFMLAILHKVIINVIHTYFLGGL